MTIINTLRKVLPRKLRITLGLWTIDQVSRSELLLKTYLALLYGNPMAELRLDGEHCYYDHKGRTMVGLRTDARVFMEMFEDEVYEQVWRPNEGDVVIDIGAYVGMFTVKSSLAIGASGKVVAVEPCAENYELLSRNCEGLSNVVLVKKAVMAESGHARMYYTDSMVANSLITEGKRYTEVETITLDELVRELKLDKVDIVKMDVEGAAIEVLKGAKEVLARGTKLAIAAYHTAPNGKPELEQLRVALQDAGYETTQADWTEDYLYAEPSWRR